MKNKQLHFFLLEFTLSLIILSVTLFAALSMFTQAAKLHSETQALRKLSQDMVITAETLRNPSSEWPTEQELKTVSSTYDVKGEPSTTGVAYTLTIQYDTRNELKKAVMTLTDKSGKVCLTLRVNTLQEHTP